MAAPPLVMVPVQPDGDMTSVGATVMKPVPGIQENQNVPIVVVPVLFSVRSY
jgi:hypothetical protein